MVQAGLNHQLGRSEFEDLIGKAPACCVAARSGDIRRSRSGSSCRRSSDALPRDARPCSRSHGAGPHRRAQPSALTVQVKPVARFLGIKNVLRTCLRTDDDGLITGEVETPIIWVPGKARAVQAFAAENGVDLFEKLLYADGDEECRADVLRQPRPTNPAAKLAAQASCGETRLAARCASAVAAAEPGVPTTHGRRAWRHWCPSRRCNRPWPADAQQAHRRQLLHVGVRSVTSTATGVNMTLLGKENLTKRPAVFIFNHRNQSSLHRGQARRHQLHLGRQEETRERPESTIGKWTRRS